jgi:arylsulfatase A
MLFAPLVVLLQPVYSQARETRADSRPNIILIMADDMVYECLSCNGSASYQTPHLDRLAKNGIRFTHCYSQPLCTPSRVKIMTGRYNFRNYQEFGYLKPTETTFGHVLQKTGYQTCVVGKWQLNGLTYRLPGFDDASCPLQAGFHEYSLWQLTQPKSKGERFADALVESNGRPARKHVGEYGPQVFADFVCDFIERNKDQPFFVYYPMVLTHNPFVPTPDSPEWKTGNRMKKDKRFFADMVAYTDRIVGQIDAKLESLGLRENTILMFTGDNGTNVAITSQLADGTSIKGGKGSTLDSGTHVPFVVSWPGTAPQGVVNTDLIGFSDFFATVVEAGGQAEASENTDGRSFLPQLKGETGNQRDFVFCHYEPRWGRWKDAKRFARDRTWKLYLDGRMYNVTDDLLEQHNLKPKDVTAAVAREKLQSVLNSMPPVETRPRIEKFKKPGRDRI